MSQLKQALAPQSQQTDIAALLRDPKLQRQMALALPKHISAERLARVALTELRRNPQLARCDQSSFLGSLMICAQLGVEPGGPLGHAWIVPFRNGKTGKIEAQFILGYRGMIDLARRSGLIVSIEARAVYECDTFECRFGLDSDLKHVPDWDNPARGNPEKLRFAYAVAKLKDGGVQFVVLSRRDIEAARAASKAAATGPWSTHYEQMAVKTAVRQLFKWVPTSIELATAIEQDERAELGLPQENPLADSAATEVLVEPETEQESAPAEDSIEEARR